MSLINDMLRDLDRRKHSDGDASLQNKMKPTQSAVKKPPLMLWILLGMLIVGGALTAAILSTLINQKPQPLAPTVVDLKPREQATDSSPDREVTAVITPTAVTRQTASAPANTTDDVTDPKQTANSGGTASSNSPSDNEQRSNGQPAATASQTAYGLNEQLLRVGWRPYLDGYRLELESSTDIVYQVDLLPRTLKIQFQRLNLVEELPPLPASWIKTITLTKNEWGTLMAINTENNLRAQVYPLRNQLVIEIMPERETKLEVAQTTTTNTGINIPMPGGDSAAKTTSKHTDGSAVAKSATASEVKTVVKTQPKPTSPAELDQQAVKQAARLVREGRWREAEAVLQKHIDSHTANINSVQLLASLLLRQGQLARADSLVSSLLTSQPNHPGLVKLKARIQIEQQQPRLAIGTLSAAPPAMASDPDYYQLWAAALQADNQHQLAAELYLKLLRTDSSKADWWLGLGISMEARNNREQARAAYQNVLQIPSATPLMNGYAQSRLQVLSET